VESLKQHLFSTFLGKIPLVYCQLLCALLLNDVKVRQVPLIHLPPPDYPKHAKWQLLRVLNNVKGTVQHGLDTAVNFRFFLEVTKAVISFVLPVCLPIRLRVRTQPLFFGSSGNLTVGSFIKICLEYSSLFEIGQK